VPLSAGVAVVGGGMAGACAALAAREAGADVLLIARAPGATAVSSGAVDMASGPASIYENALDIARNGHPYALICDLRGAIDDALSLLRRHLPLLRGAGDGSATNLLLPTPLGRIKQAALAQESIADLRAFPANARLGVAALSGAQAVEARLVAAGLRAAVLELDFYRQRADAQKQIPEMAADIDRRRGEFAESIRRAAGDVTHVLVPTVGLEGAHAELSAAAGRPVFELLGAPPSVPGLRLQRAIDAALEKAGVRRTQGVAEKALSGTLQVVRGVECEPVEAKAVVLASGRFLGGGIRCDPSTGELSETALGLPAWAGARRKLAALMNEELFAMRAAGRHPGMAAGLRAGAHLRALDAEGRPAMAGGAPVFAAGAALGGYDPARGEGGLGVAAVTGALAGREAARCC